MGDSDRSDFMKTVQEIKLAEEESDEILKAAKLEADRILRKAKEDVQSLKTKNEDMIVKLKNSMLDEGSREIESEVKKIVDKAKKEAEAIRKKKLAKKDIDLLVDELLSV
jgi:vacuolar-type H+-ATPase subunit H